MRQAWMSILKGHQHPYVYGSPVAPHGWRNDESVASTSHFVPLALANVNRVVSSVLHFPRERVTPEIIFLKIIDLQWQIFSLCSCKNSRSCKKTAKTPGCPCENALMKSSRSCTCGTKRTSCKNKTVEVVVNRNPSAFSRHQEQAVLKYSADSAEPDMWPRNRCSVFCHISQWINHTYSHVNSPT